MPTWLALGVLLALLLTLPSLLTNFWLRVLIQAGFSIMMALGLNVIMGYTGQFHLGYAAFYAVGAYTYGLLASRQFDVHLPFLLLFPLAGVLAAILGVLLAIPTLELRGDYLAMVTLAFGEIARLVLNNLTRLTGGPQGIIGIDHPTILSYVLRGPAAYYYLVLVLCAAEIWLMSRLERSRIGRAWTAIREDEEAAKGMGLDTGRLKLLACAIGAAPGGLAGVLFAAIQTYVSPISFQFSESLAVMSTVMIGGAGSIPGVTLASLALNVVAEPLRKYADVYRMLIYGALLVGFSLFRPQGLWPRRSRSRPDQGAAVRGSSSDKRPEAIRGAQTLPIRAVFGPERSAESTDILKVQNLSKGFGALRALHDVSFAVQHGHILSVIGPNGAGKTTAFNMITGVYPATSGNVTFLGHSILGLPQHKIAKLGIARTYQKLQLFKNISVLDNVLVATYCRTSSGVWDAFLQTPKSQREEEQAKEKALELLRFVGIDRYRGHLARELAYGDQRRLEIARALATEPSLLLLDEPTAGMNPIEKDEMMSLIRTIRDRGVAVVLVEHDMGVVMGISDWIVVLDHGVKICEGSAGKVQCDPAVIEAYLGSEAIDVEEAG